MRIPSRSILAGLAAILAAALIIWLALPGLIIRYLEKNDTAWIGRELTIQDLRLNPFTFAATLEGLSVHERASDSAFVLLDKAYGNLDPWALIRSELRIEEIWVEGLHARVIQEGAQFNFSDLVARFSSQQDSSASAPDWTLAVDVLRLRSSSVDYEDRNLGSRLLLDSIALSVDSFTTEEMFVHAGFQLSPAAGGSIEGLVDYQVEAGDVHLQTTLEALQLQAFQPYLAPYVDLGDLEGLVVADLNARTNIQSRDYIALAGSIGLADLKIADPALDTLITLGQMNLKIDSLDTRLEQYDFGEVTARDIFIRFEYYPEGDNFTRLLRIETASPGEKEEQTPVATKPTSEYYYSPLEYLALYIYDLTRDYIFKAYSVDSLAVHDLHLKLYDYSLEDPFFMELDSLHLSAGDIRTEDEVAEFDFDGIINRTGSIAGKVEVSREGIENMDLEIDLKGVFLSGFSPYSRFYTAHPILDGAVNIHSLNHIENYYLTSTNRVFAENIEVGKKQKTKGGYTLPLRLAVLLIRDKDKNIDLEVPIEGQLNDPRIKFGTIIWQTLKNLMEKIVTAPFRLLADAFSLDEEDLKTIRFDNGQSNLEEPQLKSLKAIAKVLESKPELQIELRHQYNREYELEALAVTQLKAAYVGSLPTDSLEMSADSTAISPMDFSTGDPEFLQYLRKEVPAYDSTLAIAEIAMRTYGKDSISLALERVLDRQKALVRHYLEDERGFSTQQFRIVDGANDPNAINQSHPIFAVSLREEEPL